VPVSARAPKMRTTRRGPFVRLVRSIAGKLGWRSTVGEAVCRRGGTASSTTGTKGAGMGGLPRASEERSILRRCLRPRQQEAGTGAGWYARLLDL